MAASQIFAASRRRVRQILRSISTSDSANPLISTANLPAFGSIEPHNVPSALERVIGETQNGLRALESSLSEGSVKPTWSSVNEEVERISAAFGHAWGTTSHLMSVKNSPELRQAYDDAQEAVVNLSQQISQSQPLYNAYKKMMASEGALDSTQTRIAEQIIRDAELSGVGFDDSDPRKKKFNELKLQLSKASTAFSNNVLDATNAYELHITDECRLDGVPETSKSLMAQAAKSKGHDEGWLLTLDMPCVIAIMTHAKDRSLRETLYRANITKASVEESKANWDLIAEILSGRQRKAELLGYSNHAEVSLASKMAGSVQEVTDLLENLRKESFDRAKSDLASIQAYANDHGFCDGPLRHWDVSFWSERMKEDVYAVNEEELRQYFPVDRVLEGMFAFTAKMFGIEIREANGKAEVWHPDVRFFEVFDISDGKHVASFFVDLYVRPGEKRGGAWMNSAAQRSSVLQHIPVAYLICNQAPGTGDKPSLMTFNEVTTLWHEFGHTLQHCLTRVKYSDAAGISGVEWDAVELPSQLMENFIMCPAVMKTISRHYVTGETLPDNLYQKLKAADRFMSGWAMVRQLYFAALDMKLHSATPRDDAAVTKEWIRSVQADVAASYQVLQPLPEDGFLCSFGHIFSGGYSAGYYSYKWAEVMSEDAFAAFEEAGINEKGLDDPLVLEVGSRFRDTVLALGGSCHASDVFKQFRGRAPDVKPLLNRYFGSVGC